MDPSYSQGRDAAPVALEAGQVHVENTTDAAQPAALAADAADATGPTPSQVPSWAEPLLGRYASKTVAVSQDSFNTLTATTTLALADFVRGDAGLQLRTKICDLHATSALADMELVSPDAVPAHVEDVTFSDTESRWGTNGPTLALGYSDAPPAACSGHTGANVARATAQVWLGSGQCRCPLAGEDPLSDDCRVLDPDADQHPGITFQLTSTTGDRTYYMGNASDSHYANGQVDGTGKLHVANFGASEHFYQFGVDPSGSPNLALIARSCPTSFNHAQFARLADGTTCADVLAQASALFTDGAPSLTTRCFQ